MNEEKNILRIPAPVSLGLLLSYKCNTRCRYCIYASSPDWNADWISENDYKIIFSNLSEIFNETPRNRNYNIDPDRISFSHGLHFTGGEPFLNFKLLTRMTELARDFKIPGTFVETNCFWAKDDELTAEKLIRLKKAGLRGILISANPFTVEFIPFERIERTARIGYKVFGSNLIVYQDFYLRLFKQMKLKGKLSFEDFLKKIDISDFYDYIELLPMGRTPYRLGNLFKRYPAEVFLSQNCQSEMTRNWHTHIDNYCNYIPGYCAGISLGDFRNYESIFIKGIDIDKKPVIKALLTDLSELLKIGKYYGFKESSEGYISKCHLCTDIRKQIVSRTSEFKELAPLQFYENLN